MCLLPTKEATEKADAPAETPTETFVNSDATADEKPSIDASQIDPKSKENADD